MRRVLLERDALLLGLRDLLDEALRGQGHLVFVAGEAGVGKTTLLSAFVAALALAGSAVTVRRGTCDDLITPAPLGPLLEAVPSLADLVEAEHPPPRRTLFRRVSEMLAAEPTVLVLDDLQWADEATLDLLRHLGRRMDTLPILVVAAFREEAATPGHPLAVTLGDLTSSTSVVRLRVPPLTRDAVRTLAEASGSDLDAARLFDRTGGNPFYVTETLASGGDRLPATVRDAVLARVSRLSAEGRQVLAAAAVLGQPAEVGLLTAVSGCPATAVDECVTAGLLVGDGQGWDFRHALARVAVAETLLPSTLVELHAAALVALKPGGDDRRLTFHAESCGDHEAVRRHGPRAAQRAARLGAHRQAAELYRVSLAAHPPDDPRRHELCSVLAYEYYLTGESDLAAETMREALELAAGPFQRGVSQRWLSRISWFLARGDEAAMWADAAVESLEPLGPSAELAMAYSNQAQLAMLSYDVDAAVDWGERALTLARQVGDREAEIHALNNVGAALAQTRDYIGGTTRMQQSLDLAIAADAQEHAARAFTNLGSIGVSRHRFGDADRHLRAGLAYATERDLDSWSQYMNACRARSLAEQGHFAAAADLAARLLAHPHVAEVVRIPAAAVVAQVAVRRGEDATALLEEAAAMATRSEEAQRLVPVAVSALEAAWVSGHLAELPEVAERAWAVAVERPHPWELGELAWWLAVAGRPRPTPVTVAEPFRLMLDGSWREAADRWGEVGSPWWVAICLARLPDLHAARRALEILDELGAPATREAVLRDRRTVGLSVPRGPREPTSIDGGGLTARELDVLALLVEGLSNAGIAEALVLSPKTVGHHVSSVLAKLGEPTRARAAATAVRRGLVHPAVP